MGERGQGRPVTLAPSQNTVRLPFPPFSCPPYAYSHFSEPQTTPAPTRTSPPATTLPLSASNGSITGSSQFSSPNTDGGRTPKRRRFECWTSGAGREEICQSGARRVRQSMSESVRFFSIFFLSCHQQTSGRRSLILTRDSSQILLSSPSSKHENATKA